MHNSYFLLQRLAAELSQVIVGYTFGEVFSQNKDELIIGLYDEKHTFYIKANLNAQFSCLSFPDNYTRARKNSVDLFGQLINKTIKSVETGQNERCLKVNAGDYTLLFKMYGNRSNILLFHLNKVVNIFKQKFDKDYKLVLDVDFDRQLDLGFDNFAQNILQLNKFIPTIARDDLNNIFHQDQYGANLQAAHQSLLNKIGELERGSIFINQDHALPQLRLYEAGKSNRAFSSAIVALNDFYVAYSKQMALEKRKQQLLSEKLKELKKIESYLLKTNTKLNELETGESYKQQADIIMANLHAIKTGSEYAELHNFYSDKPIKIKLKKDLSPQKNAENFYRKSKNQKIEIEKVRSNISAREKEHAKLKDDLLQIEGEVEFKNFKKYEHAIPPKLEKDLPYHILWVGEYQILIGKNAKNNDMLTFKVADKNDIWLHVKDAPGSHVVIRQIAGKNVSAMVLEKAASLAAWFSRRKTEGLVPVSWTERKYVRKTKNLLPGQVIVQKEKVILAEPVNWLVKN